LLAACNGAVPVATTGLNLMKARREIKIIFKMTLRNFLVITKSRSCHTDVETPAVSRPSSLYEMATNRFPANAIYYPLKPIIEII